MHLRVHVRVTALAAAIFAAASCMLAASAQAASVGGFSVRPAHFNAANPATRAYFIKSARPGHTVSDEVVVNNGGATPIQLRIYPVDGLTGATSGAVYSDARDPLRKAGRWVTPSVNFLTVPAGASRLVSFAVTVPPGTPAGDHLAGIAAENAHPQKSAGRFSITEIVRAVVGVEVEVPGPAHPQGALAGMHLAALPGTKVPSVVVALSNTGLKLCKPTLAVTLAGARGAQPTVTRRLDTVLPGDSIPYPLPWPHPLPSGAYVSSATVSGCGQPVTFRTVTRLGGDLTGTAANPNGLNLGPARAGANASWWLVGAAAGAGLLIGLAALLFWLILARRRRRWEAEARPVRT
jgi:hypothetical protein